LKKFSDANAKEKVKKKEIDIFLGVLEENIFLNLKLKNDQELLGILSFFLKSLRGILKMSLEGLVN
jgi:hypothetical protein